MRSRALATVVLASLAALCGVDSSAQEQSPVYLDPEQPLDRRVDDLVGRMTLEEKASQLVNRTRAIPRLGVPEYNLSSEALHGVANNGIATVFPQAIGLAATFDTALAHEMAKATALEGRAKGRPAGLQGRRPDERGSAERRAGAARGRRGDRHAARRGAPANRSIRSATASATRPSRTRGSACRSRRSPPASPSRSTSR